ncbi:START-like domain-containing protein [Reichenbachiella versicolor]|uniref:START-like domain-containing protein n=1 Tax=Reichenbachiella versicolor TaxID=1821036 RepID=UPI000D6E4B2A|nr:START-like domain-containing protein [Reichenbachiella versicolor]
MSKFEFVGEYEFKASNKMLYTYLSTASGLAQWYADDVNINPQKNLIIIWDGEENLAKIVSHRTNHEIKIEFIDEEDPDPSYVKFEILTSEMTSGNFLKVTDYSEIDDQEELRELWDGLIHDLKEIVGG